MKAKEAINILKMFNENTEVELIFPDAAKAMPVRKPVKPMTEGEMAALPMYPHMTYAAEDGYPIYHPEN